MQRSPDEAADFCKRKVEHLKKQLDELGTEMDAKQKAIMQINQIMVQRRREATPRPLSHTQFEQGAGIHVCFTYGMGQGRGKRQWCCERQRAAAVAGSLLY